jgi:D-alanyl-D-alanine endopeptidase (penicillin-binding protein 7)
MRTKRLVSAVLALLLCSLSTAQAAGPDSGSLSQADRLWEQLDERKLTLRSEAALVVDHFGNTLYERKADDAKSIASLTKLMTAIVILDAGLPLDEQIEITKADRDLIKLTGSRLKYGARLSRGELLTLTLMSSENRAAAALARTYPGGTERFVAQMNATARALDLHDTRFADAAGLDAGNVSTARDLAGLVFVAMRYPAIREATTRRQMSVRPYKGRGPLRYVNTNRLLKNRRWAIQVSKTGYINEAGRCLVMHTEFEGTPTVVVFLNAFGKLTPFGDANRVRKWIEAGVQTEQKERGVASRDLPSGSGDAG